MRWVICHIEDIRRYEAPGHTAYLNAFRRPCLSFFSRNSREAVQKATEPPPARPVTSTRYPNAYQAADFTQLCEVGRTFFVYRHQTRCRSPPIKISRLPSVTINFDWKGNFIMDKDIRAYVVNLLETCQERRRKIALLHYELEHPAHTSEAEMISAMALGYGNGSGGGHPDGHISDKTLYIALNYQNRTDELNADIKEEIVVQLVELEWEQERLEYYTSLLEKRQALVIRLAYFEGLPWDEVAKEAGAAVRTVHKIKNQALEQLAEMYQFTGHHS